MGTLEGKVAFITGAGQGVGQGVAFALAREGASIAVTTSQPSVAMMRPPPRFVRSCALGDTTIIVSNGS